LSHRGTYNVQNTCKERNRRSPPTKHIKTDMVCVVRYQRSSRGSRGSSINSTARYTATFESRCPRPSLPRVAQNSKFSANFGKHNANARSKFLLVQIPPTPHPLTLTSSKFMNERHRTKSQRENEYFGKSTILKILGKICSGAGRE